MAAAPAFAQETAVGGEAKPPAGADAQTPPVDKATGEAIRARADEILVVATRIKGQVDAPQAPIMTLDEEDIASYGAASLTDLLAELSPQTGSGRGRGDGHPVVLLNGRRISNFREMRDLPPEAIRRVEILPEEVALRYGYPPNQRVVNFILKDNFASRTLAGEYDLPTHGGFADSELEAGMVAINGPRRLNLTGKFNGTTMLTEAERGVKQTAANLPTVAGDPDPAQFRSLIDSSREYSLNGTWSTAFGKGADAAALTINGTVDRTDSHGFNGLDTVTLTGPGPNGPTAQRSLPDPLAHTTHATTFSGGLTFNKPVSGWQLTATLDGSYSDTTTDSDLPRDLSALVAAARAGTLAVGGPLPALAPGGVERAHTQDYGLTSLLTFAGRPFRMPAGDASLTLKAGFNYTRSDNSDTQTARATSLDRGDASAGINLALPITSRKNDVLGGVGDVSLNFSAGLDHLSDFGTLKDWSGGVTWAPTEKLQFQASYIVNEAAPSLNQLGNPTLSSFNVPVFDFTTGQTALVTIINGGNPNLKRETQRDLKLSANWDLPFLKNSNLIVEYFRNHSSDVTEDFPLLTPEIEAAFPSRVVRGANGQLVSIDRRPVTFSEVNGSRLRSGLNVSGTIGKPQPGGRRGLGGFGGPGGPRGGGGMGGGGGRGFGAGGFGGGGPGGRGGNGQGRWNLSLFYTEQFTSTVLVAPGGPVLDLLNGDALAAGGTPRHGLELEGGAFYKGFGLRLNGTWSAPATIRSTGLPGSTDLRFGSVTKLNLRAFVNFDQQKKLVRDVPFLKGARLTLKVDNLLDSRQRVTDGNGVVPLSYQPDYRDPRGRVIGLDFRKMF
ncbi:MAG: TonB-dependent receptor [Sphingomonadales bacterium]|nr:TonB-dependent receptor [Sphingomonadales bacterium]